MLYGSNHSAAGTAYFPMAISYMHKMLMKLTTGLLIIFFTWCQRQLNWGREGTLSKDMVQYG
jgi:hypothetical protein